MVRARLRASWQSVDCDAHWAPCPCADGLFVPFDRLRGAGCALHSDYLARSRERGCIFQSRQNNQFFAFFNLRSRGLQPSLVWHWYLWNLLNWIWPFIVLSVKYMMALTIAFGNKVGPSESKFQVCQVTKNVTKVATGQVSTVSSIGWRWHLWQIIFHHNANANVHSPPLFHPLYISSIEEEKWGKNLDKYSAGHTEEPSSARLWSLCTLLTRIFSMCKISVIYGTADPGA